MADETDHKLFVEFFPKTEPDPVASREAGMPKFKTVDMISIKWPGDKSRHLVAPANSPSLRGPDGYWLTYAQRWPEHFKAYKAGQEYIGDGVPISEAPFLTEARRMELKAQNIHTIEALRDMPDNIKKKVGHDGHELSTQAKVFLEKQAGFAVESRLAAQNEALQAQVTMLSEQMANLMKAGPVAKPQEASPFMEMGDDELKAYIKDASGSLPRGQPSHETLVRMCDEIIAKDKEKAAA
jgi:hypothetical protein